MERFLMQFWCHLMWCCEFQAARRAALMTNNKSFDVALEWALEHSEDKDFNEPMPGYGDDEDEANVR